MIHSETFLTFQVTSSRLPGAKLSGGLKTVPFSRRRLQPAGCVGLRLLFLGLLSQAIFAPDLAYAEVDFFQEKISPILANRCIGCHDGSGESDVRLSSINHLLDGGWVVPGDDQSSELFRLIEAVDGEPPRMPPEGDRVSKAEIQLLRQWINGGADWPDDAVMRSSARADLSWWSLQPIVAKSDRSIDALIDHRLQSVGLERSGRADREVLIRRLHYDLHGLPPDPQQIRRFVADESPDAWRQLVDRTLDSPRYGERYASHWLDLAHYADTHGFERDKRRENAWRYRDYVIDSFNQDKPYDEFLQEQIAGDILRPNDFESIVATGFLAAGPWDYVGQVETKSPVLRRSARSLDLDDMVTQVMTSATAMTVHCARCHDHKLDPISQKDYYRLRSVFAGVKRGDRVVLKSAIEKYNAEKKRLEKSRSEVAYRVAQLEGEGLSLADVVGGGDGLGAGDFRSGIDPRTAKVQTRDFGALGNVVTNRFTPSPFPFVDGVVIPDGVDNQQTIQVSSTGLTVRGIPSTSGAAWDVIRNGPVASQHSPELGGVNFTEAGHDLIGLHANAAITFDLDAIRLAMDSHELTFRSQLGYFGAQGGNQADVWVLLDGRIVLDFPGLKRSDGLKEIGLKLSESERFLTLMATDGGNGYAHDQIGFGDPKIVNDSVKSLSRVEFEQLTRLRAEMEILDEAIEILGPPPRVFAVNPIEQPEAVRLLRRGDPETPEGEVLSPGALTCVSGVSFSIEDDAATEGAYRVALAKWLTDIKHPLTYRVIANRVWQWHFGVGIVKTSSDFGFGGSRPTHPELLDWLAHQLRRSGGSLKALHRLILLSETYQQSSFVDAGHAALKFDAENELLWRQNSVRLPAEAIRDSILAVSGKLNLKMGGPGFEDFIYKEAYAPIYQYVVADDPSLWRRSIYRYVVRTTPNEFLSTFDCPDPATFTPRRLATTTPLQSLALFNNELVLRQSEWFSRRLKSEVGDGVNDQVQRGFLLAFGREPEDAELVLSARFVHEHGLFAFCRSLFNSNEFLNVD